MKSLNTQQGIVAVPLCQVTQLVTPSISFIRVVLPIAVRSPGLLNLPS
jgi:hypothetical protein